MPRSETCPPPFGPIADCVGRATTNFGALSSDEKQGIIDAYNEGLTYYRISKTLNVSLSTVYNTIKNYKTNREKPL